MASTNNGKAVKPHGRTGIPLFPGYSIVQPQFRPLGEIRKIFQREDRTIYMLIKSPLTGTAYQCLRDTLYPRTELGLAFWACWRTLHPFHQQIDYKRGEDNQQQPA